MGTLSKTLKKLIANRKQRQRVKRGYYEKDRVKTRKNRLDQKSLQVKDTGFKTYDPHPFAKGVIFQSYRHKQGRFQRWMRGDESSRGHQSKARILSESLQTNKPIGYWHRGNPHPQNKKYVFSQYTSHDPRSNCESILVNGYFYRKYNPEQWIKIGTKWCPSIISREKSLFKKRHEKLQTGSARGFFKCGDPHPKDVKYVFKQYTPSDHETWQTPKMYENAKSLHKKSNQKRKITDNNALINFYKKTEYPKHLWHKRNFALEKDLQSAIEHYLVKELNLKIIHEMDTGNGRVDIHIPSINLNIEVKLTSDRWNINEVAKQKSRYDKIAETIIVSLDGKPDGWMTPKELFCFIKKRSKLNWQKAA